MPATSIDRQLTQKTRVQSKSDDLASNVRQNLPCAQCLHSAGRCCCSTWTVTVRATGGIVSSEWSQWSVTELMKFSVSGGEIELGVE